MNGPTALGIVGMMYLVHSEYTSRVTVPNWRLQFPAKNPSAYRVLLVAVNFLSLEIRETLVVGDSQKRRKTEFVLIILHEALLYVPTSRRSTKNLRHLGFPCGPPP